MSMSPLKEKLWVESIKQEAKLRLKWFNKNEERLEEAINKPPLMRVPQEMKDKLVHDTINAYQNKSKATRVKPDEMLLPYNSNFNLDIMKPVDKKVTDLIYSGTQKDGRNNYLKERYKLNPENKFYLPEVTSWIYGWKLDMENRHGSEFGVQKVIETSFYRRRGVERNPDWYKEPSKSSPDACGLCL